MTGPEHHDASEEAVSDARSYAPDERAFAGLMQLAQVHATLAVADELRKLRWYAPGGQPAP